MNRTGNVAISVFRYDRAGSLSGRPILAVASTVEPETIGSTINVFNPTKSTLIAIFYTDISEIVGKFTAETSVVPLITSPERGMYPTKDPLEYLSGSRAFVPKLAVIHAY